MTTRKAMDGMTAAAQAAYALSETALIFPITPASHMAETVERWSCQGRKNLFGAPVDVKEMQSEKGVAGALHGALAGGALASTFTASQGLMLMIPNLYKLSGELLPAVAHVTCRSLASHALSIFGDHQDLMAVRATGVAMLGSATVQECMDLSLVAHLSAIDGSVPFVHFFDGFRTSDAIESVEVIDPDDMAKLVDWSKVRAFRARCLEPERPQIRGTAQNPDIYFQNREAANPYYDALPGIVQANMDKVAQLTGRQYHLFDYDGAPDAERVIVTMASSAQVAAETARALAAQGEKVGVVTVRLYRPFSAERLMDAIPATCKVVSCLDRTKEPGSQGEPLYQDVAMAVLNSGRAISVLGGRYGLSSKDFDPAMVKAVFDNMAAPEPKRRFTVGIDDDVTHLSLSVGEPLNTLPGNPLQAVFYGFGSDGTVGASKQLATLLGDNAGYCSQEYSWYDSKKSGGLTICYLRFGKDPIDSAYLVGDADYVACNKSIYVRRGYPMADRLKEGGTFVLNSPWGTVDAWEKHVPAELRRALAAKKAKVYNVDASGLAEKCGLGPRINMIMEAVFLKLANPMDYETAVAALKHDIQQMYAAKGSDVVAHDIAAVSQALDSLAAVEYPDAWADAQGGMPSVREEVQAKGGDDQAAAKTDRSAYAQDVFWPMEELRGDSLPVSKMAPDGIVEPGTCALEKRTVAFDIPEWDVDKCIQCYECSYVCPHAAIRPYLATDEELALAPDTYKTKPANYPGLEGLHFRIQVYPEDCVGCGSCAFNCPAPGKALVMKPLGTQIDEQKQNLSFAQANVSIKDDLLPNDTIPGTQLRQPLFEFSSACAGCGETPHIKLLTQLFGDRLIMANATGCSSIYGAYMPAMPYTVDKNGHGPAWGNSLFEDNGEYGYGIAKAVKIRRDHLTRLVQKAVDTKAVDAPVAALMSQWLEQKDDPDVAYGLGQAIQGALRQVDRQKWETRKDPASRDELVQEILDYGEMFGKKSVWAVGGDGWAYDIDFGGLDEVVASGENVNVLVLDTEGYSNTGGEMSKATQLGAVTGFTYDGKGTPKKDMGRMLMQYGDVYVAHVCLGGDFMQVIKALREADAYDGPSVVIALCPCISWGIHGGMSSVVGVMRDAVATGYWPLWRFNPALALEGKDPLVIDSPAPSKPLQPFLDNMNRYKSLGLREPDRQALLASELSKDIDRIYEQLDKMVAVWAPDAPKASDGK